MLTEIEPITVEDMLLDWGLAEAAKPEMQLDAAILHRVLARAESSEDRLEIVQRIKEHRAPLLKFIAMYPVQWFKANLSVKSIGEISVVRYFQQTHGSHIQTIADVAEHLSEIYSIPNFRHTEMRGLPMFVTTKLQAPLCLIEGTHRCRELLREQNAALNVRIVVGECPRIAEWNFWPDHREI